MKTMLLYRPNTDHERAVLDYLRDFKMQTGRDLETVDVDSPQGAEMCELYDIMEYPAVLVTNDDGKVQNIWSGELLPRISEVSYYVNGGAS